MADYVTLLGAEDVRSAGSAMRGAADEMQRAAANIDGSLTRHQQFLDDWLMRLKRTIQDAVTMAVYPPQIVTGPPGPIEVQISSQSGPR